MAITAFLAIFILGGLFAGLKPLADAVRITGPVAGNNVGDHGENLDVIQLWFKAQSFDPVLRTAEFNTFPWTSEEGTFSSSAIAPRSFRLFLDELYGKGSYEFRKDERAGAIPFEVDVLSIPERGSRASDFFYPLDSYVLDAYAEVSQIQSQDESIPAFEYFYETQVRDFRVSYTRIAGWNFYDMPGESNASEILSERRSGQISFLAKFERSLAVQVVTILILVILIINTIALVWITRKILTRLRPPSIQVLVWSAASVLSYIQLRDSLPGSPRLGIAIDYLFYFPALIVSVTVSLLITISWSTRSDFAQ
jgi:hypothetical protein